MMDVITMGETMIRLSAPAIKRLENSSHVELHVGGSESNVAVGLARLGLQVAWLSRLTDNVLGRMIENSLRSHGVDTSHLVWTSNDRIGLYFHEEGVAPRPSRVLYDRQDSAFCFFSSDDLSKTIIASTPVRLFHTSGISLAVSEWTRETIVEAIRLARNNNALISFDLNYRSKLWSADDARRICEPVFRDADICFLPKRDAIAVLGISPPSSDTGNQIAARHVMQQLKKRFPKPTIVMTDGDQGAWATSDDEPIYQPAFQVANPIGRLGGGDAFAAGFLFQRLSNQSVESSLRFACAAASLKYTQAGDMPIFNKAEIDQLILANYQSVER